MPNAFCHIELTTGDTGKASKFYKGLFDWKLRDMKMGPGMTYTMLDAGKQPGGGIQGKPMPEAPTAWMPYVEVADVRKTMAKAQKLGAQVIQDYMEMGGNGALGIFVDPTGAMLGIWEPSRKAAPAKKASAARKKAAPAKKKSATRKK